MKTIWTLKPDIYEKIAQGADYDEAFLKTVSSRLIAANSGKERKAPSLRLSKMGDCCPKALWHSIHTPGEATALQPWAIFKYSYGHIIEALAIHLAREAGHDVTGEQDEVILDGVVGHRDCIIDGCLVDVKSTSSLGFPKFDNGTLYQDDMFGYLDQLDGYLVASVDDPKLIVKDRGYILAIDKSLGKIALYEHTLRADRIRERVKQYKIIVAAAVPPPCGCGTQTDGESGNIILDTRASYSDYRYTCFPHLRTILSSRGPKYYTKLVKFPKYKGIPLIEVDKKGERVYNYGIT